MVATHKRAKIKSQSETDGRTETTDSITFPANAVGNRSTIPRRSHASPLLTTLHWLAVRQRIDYKVALLTFTVRSTSTPSYLCRLIQDRQHSHNLRSATTTLCQPSTTTTFAKSACRCSAPAVWNSLPETVVNNDSGTVFKSRLKTFLFSRAFSLPFSQ